MKHKLKSIIEGAEEIIPLVELEKKISQEKPLVIKLGADPTSPNIHLGHVIVLEKLRDFQVLGYDIFFLIGDFTARIGDPSGKSKTRIPLNDYEIAQNVQTYSQQIGRVLDMSKVKIVFNADWFNSFSAKDFLKLMSQVTLSQIIERDDFHKRFQAHKPIALHELIYPLLQGYDSVVLRADVEIGGTDQKFNMLMGRTLQLAAGLEPQVIITMPIIEGTDGMQKMSKSLKNDISLLDSPKDAFLKIMNISDSLMEKYYKVFFRLPESEIKNKFETLGFMQSKKELAFDILKKYWSVEDAQIGLRYFTEVVQNKSYQKEEFIKQIVIESGIKIKIIDLIFDCDPQLSRSQIRRLVYDGAVYFDGIKIDTESIILDTTQRDKVILKVGKKKIFMINFR
jgi:tyrosyl-tRNA synthetase